MVKNLQCLKTSQICYLRHAEHHAKNRTCLRGLDHDTLFFEKPLINSIKNVSERIPKHLNELPRQVGDEFNYMHKIFEFLLYTRFFSPKVLK